MWRQGDGNSDSRYYGLQTTSRGCPLKTAITRVYSKWNAFIVLSKGWWGGGGGGGGVVIKKFTIIIGRVRKRKWTCTKQLTGSAKKGQRGAVLQVTCYIGGNILNQKWNHVIGFLGGVCDVNRSRTVRLRAKRNQGNVYHRVFCIILKIIHHPWVRKGRFLHLDQGHYFL